MQCHHVLFYTGLQGGEAYNPMTICYLAWHAD